MRLINAKTLELEEYTDPPPYAILSHTWGLDQHEVSYLDFQDVQCRTQKPGFKKIRWATQQALEDECEFVWIDTCCIDKKSSAELSEAINSMFKWYSNSQICYAYLEDVPVEVGTGHDSPTLEESKFKQSRWFTRGWTLQELIAPLRLVFYGAGWVIIGDKRSLLGDLKKITRIDHEVLKCGVLSDVPIATRMSWAAGRRTKREEDIAYCLMGLFNVNMTMLYGEGSEAFTRLQEEILKDSDDQSLFAWRATEASASRFPYRGILAMSPDEFVDCGDIIPFRSLRATQAQVVLTSRGIRFTSALMKWPDMPYKAVLCLNCHRGENSPEMIGVTLWSSFGDQYVRTEPSSLTACQYYDRYDQQNSIYVLKSLSSVILTRQMPALLLGGIFFITQMSPGISVLRTYRTESTHDPGTVLKGGTAKKLAIVLGSVAWGADCLAVIMQEVRKEGRRTWERPFDIITGPVEGIGEAIEGFRLDKASTERKHVHFSGSRWLARVIVKPGTLPGVESICIDVELKLKGREGQSLL